MGSNRETEKKHAPTVPMSRFLVALADRRNWQGGNQFSGERTYVGPGVEIPPRREDCSCACKETDELGRPKFIGWCGRDCERRPR